MIVCPFCNWRGSIQQTYKGQCPQCYQMIEGACIKRVDLSLYFR